MFISLRSIVRSLAGCALLLSAASAQTGTATAYQPAQQVSGTIRVWGHGNRTRNYLGDLIPALNVAFHKLQPGATVESGMLGDASAIGGLYTGAADVALMDRRISAIELDGYQQAMGFDPTEITVATGSLRTAAHSPALVLFVNQDNPLKNLTLAQLDAIYDADHRRGAAAVTTWGELGLTGKWASAAIHPVGYTLARRESQSFEKTVMKGSQKWVCTLAEYDYTRADKAGAARAGAEIQAAVAKDPYAIGIATLETGDPGVKALALSSVGGGAAVLPAEATVASRAYPLAESISVFVNRPKDAPLDPKVQEFVRFLLSREGQAILHTNGGYLPLPGDLLAQERSKLQ